MKICVLTHTFPRNKSDVAAAFMKEFCDGLVENGNKVVVVTPFDQKFNRHGDTFKIVTYKYIWPDKFHQLGYSKTMQEGIKLRRRAYLLLPFLLIGGFFALLKAVRKEEMELISVHWVLPNGLIALLVSKITGVPYVITLPGTDAYLAQRYKIFGWVAKIILRNSKGIISNSRWLLSKVSDLGTDDKPNAVIGYPVNVSKFKPTTKGLDIYKEKLGLTNKNIVILAVGRLEYKKGFEYLIKALPKILKKSPNIRLIIGGEGDLRNDLESLSKKLNLKGKVIFVGTIPRDKIIYYYNLADIMVAPSIVDKSGNVDGGPVVSMESMACGKPQIVTNILGVADFLKDGINGYVIPQKDSKALASAVKKLAESQFLREKMGKNNRQLVIEKLSTQYIGKRYTAFFERAMKSYGYL